MFTSTVRRSSSSSSRNRSCKVFGCNASLDSLWRVSPGFAHLFAQHSRKHLSISIKNLTWSEIDHNMISSRYISFIFVCFNAFLCPFLFWSTHQILQDDEGRRCSWHLLTSVDSSMELDITGGKKHLFLDDPGSTQTASFPFEYPSIDSNPGNWSPKKYQKDISNTIQIYI